MAARVGGKQRRKRCYQRSGRRTGTETATTGALVATARFAAWRRIAAMRMVMPGVFANGRSSIESTMRVTAVGHRSKLLASFWTQPSVKHRSHPGQRDSQAQQQRQQDSELAHRGSVWRTFRGGARSNWHLRWRRRQFRLSWHGKQRRIRDKPRNRPGSDPCRRRNVTWCIWPSALFLLAARPSS